MIITCVKEGCYNKFEYLTRSRICVKHRQKPPKSYYRPRKSIDVRVPAFQMLYSDPYRMYLYLLDKMEQENLPIINKPKTKWFNLK